MAHIGARGLLSSERGLGPSLRTRTIDVILAAGATKKHLVGDDDEEGAPHANARRDESQGEYGQGLDFSVRGGREHGIPIVVSSVEKGGAACKAGLEVGHEILAVNATSLHNATHSEGVQALAAACAGTKCGGFGANSPIQAAPAAPVNSGTSEDDEQQQQQPPPQQGPIVISLTVRLNPLLKGCITEAAPLAKGTRVCSQSETNHTNQSCKTSQQPSSAAVSNVPATSTANSRTGQQ
ncbi:hypothetical protein PTSG_02317 [Salpingoeca rosetta]|uniref:PDZ domain-containing protein n=1 Tax=Salpingoeca rosetta (strain ATCC 50818 / BSB-021) TaxID=946362 RepID=F2U1V0_SALR5|nr:uncharacterized protein PTSG_02317 [Salpingoeca rosetta]EGD81602.1 hypothetical protein PTSG_02317 [Salpingoeca rosetta]|eukprot:XP_004996806.1 hypothetical protein PTSG_02317 [Salpingoeca rosetta]